VRWFGRRHLGSALRLSQPLSGFGRPEPRGLVSCHYRPWDPPFRAFPSQGSRSPLEVASSLAVIHQRAEVSSCLTVHRRFHRPPRRWTQLPGFPGDYGLRFHEPKLASPSTWARLGGAHLVPPASPASKPSSPCETVPAASGRPSVAGRFSPGFLPLRSLLLPRLGFSTRPDLMGSGSLLRPKTPVCDSEDRWPPVPGEVLPSTSTWEDLVDGFQTLEDWTAPPLDGDSFSLGLGCRASPAP
jgi:hypothetical protein